MRTPYALIGLALSACALAFTSQEPTPKPQEKGPLAVGEKAPSFTLNEQSGQLVQVGGKSDAWTVLAFYPKALTGG